MTPGCFGALAIGNIIVCLTLAVILFIPAAFGGFNSIAVVFYVSIFTSMGLSFYLLAKRKELSPALLRRSAIFAGMALLFAFVAPMLITLGYVLASGR